METLSHDKQSQSIPPVAALAACFLVAGLGTVVLGPILPSIASQWHLSDAQSGRLLFAKFSAACVGGMSISPRLRRSSTLGAFLAAVGFAGFSFSSGVAGGSIALVVAGFGLGQLIASSNMLAGLRFTGHTGSGLAAVNFFFSLGAVITGVLTARLLPAIGLRNTLLSLATLFLVCAFVTTLPGSVTPAAAESGGGYARRRVVILFGTLLFLYGGLETSLSSWLTTFGQRYQHAGGSDGQSALVIFWASLMAGRILASVLLRLLPERATASISVLAAALACGSLAWFHQSHLCFVATCVALGLAVAPYFPSVFGMLMRHGPSPRQAGTALAVSGLGAAFFSWLTGVVSTHAGNLRTGMFVPAALALLLAAGAGRTTSAAP